MVRRRWPDILVILGIALLGALGVWALWGDQISGKDEAPAKQMEEATHGGGQT
jgi:hypothetical protein